MEIDYWISPRGEKEVDNFIKRLPFKSRRKIESIIDRLKRLGLQPLINNEQAKPLKGHKNLFELKTNKKAGVYVRVFFTIRNNTACLLHGLKKKKNKTPKKDLNIAEIRKKSVLGDLK